MTKKQAQLWEELKKACAYKHLVLVAQQYPPLPRLRSSTPSHDSIIHYDYCDLLQRHKT